MGQDAASQLKLLLTTADQPPAAPRLGNPLLKWQITDPTGTLPEWAKAGPLGQIGEEGEVAAPIPRGVWEGPQTTCSWDDTWQVYPNTTLGSQGGPSGNQLQ